MATNVPERLDTYRLEDKALKGSDALPTADGTSYGCEVSIGALTAKGARLSDVEAVVSHPAIGDTPLPNGDTIIFSLMGDTVAPIDSSSVVIAGDFATVTGVTSGIAANPDAGRAKIPSDSTYVVLGLRAVAAGGTGDISGIDMTLSLDF